VVQPIPLSFAGQFRGNLRPVVTCDAIVQLGESRTAAVLRAYKDAKFAWMKIVWNELAGGAGSALRLFELEKEDPQNALMNWCLEYFEKQVPQDRAPVPQHPPS